MDGQRTDWKGSGSMRRPRFRIGLRMLLLLMALPCVLLAYLRAALDSRSQKMRERLFHLSTEKSLLMTDLDEVLKVPSRRAKLAQVETEIAELERKLDTSVKPAK